MKIFILTEAGKDIGMGHISRCSSIYDELVSHNMNVEFLIQSEMEEFDLLIGRKYKVVDWQTNDFIAKYINNRVYCIVDSYTVSASFLEFIKKHSFSCLYLDDTGRVNYPLGIVVNPSLTTHNIDYPDTGGITYLLGKDYVILRPAFVNSNRESIKEVVSDVLITMGGSDIHNLTHKILQKLYDSQKEIQFHVVLGNGYQNKEKLIGESYSNVTFYENLKDTEMNSLMLKCDMAITAGGQTIYELLTTKTPFIPIQTADNQKNNMDGLKEHGIVQSIVTINDSEFISEVEQIYNKLLNHDEREKQIEKKLIDGRGTKRIVNQIFRKLYFLRDADKGDMESVFNLTNQDYVRKYSIQKENIQWEEHVEWFEKIMKSENDYFYVITNNNRDFLGQIRYKKENDLAVVSISLGEALVGKGLSRYFLKNSIDLLKSREKSLTKLIAYISVDNIASQHLFKGAGFKYLDLEKEMEQYEYIF